MNTTLNAPSVSSKAASTLRDEARELVAALPIVIFAKAIREAFARPVANRATIRRIVAR